MVLNTGQVPANSAIPTVETTAKTTAKMRHDASFVNGAAIVADGGWTAA